MNSPCVSILMNCYNGEKYLRQAIESVLSQSYQNWEVIFWDNQSTDKSAEIFRSYKDSRLKYYYAPTHTVLYGARNYAIEKATGEFIAFLDVDDWWLPEKLQKQIELFSDPQVGIVCGNYWLVNERKNTCSVMFNNQVPTGWVLNDLLKSYYPGLLTLVIRRSALTPLNYVFDSRYNLIGDMDLVVRLAISWKLDYVQEPVAFYRLHGANVSLIDAGRNIIEMEGWISEVSQMEVINKCTNFNYAKNKILYLKALQKIMIADIAGALSLFHQLPMSLLKLKLLIAMFIPISILKMVKI